MSYTAMKLEDAILLGLTRFLHHRTCLVNAHPLSFSSARESQLTEEMSAQSACQ